MRLTVLGCSGSVPGPGSPASGYLVRAGVCSVVLDLGNGTLGALQREMDPFDIDALVLSHLHSDHCADVAALTVYRRHHPQKPPRSPLPVHAPGEAASRLAAAYAPDLDERIGTDLSDIYDLHPLEPRTVHVGPIALTATEVEHPCQTFALRLSYGGRSLVYSGDTGPCRALEELASGADLLLVEASWPHSERNPAGIHLSGREAGEAAARAGVGRLLLTHIPPWTDPEQVLDEARRAYCGPVEVVRAGSSYEVTG